VPFLVVGSRHYPSRVTTAPTRTLMVAGLGILALSFLLLVVLRISTNPLPEDFAFEVMAWLRDITAYIGSGFLVAAVAVRRTSQR